MEQRDGRIDELLGSSSTSSLIADLREAYQHLRAATERLQELRERREGELGRDPR